MIEMMNQLSLSLSLFLRPPPPPSSLPRRHVDCCPPCHQRHRHRRQERARAWPGQGRHRLSCWRSTPAPHPPTHTHHQTHRPEQFTEPSSTAKSCASARWLGHRCSSPGPRAGHCEEARRNHRRVSDPSMIPGIKKARAAGIPVIDIEAYIPGAEINTYIGLDNYAVRRRHRQRADQARRYQGQHGHAGQLGRLQHGSEACRLHGTT